MKLLWIQIHDHDCNGMMEELQNRGYQATLISSTEDFLNYGETTILLGVDDTKCDEIMNVLKEYYQENMKLQGDNEAKICIYVINSFTRTMKAISSPS